MSDSIVYELSISARASWQAHALSNAGTNGSIRVMPRRQLLAGGIETDASSGNIAKFHHAALLAEYLANAGEPVCPACKKHDGRRAFALDKNGENMKKIIQGCGVCDTHGFLVPSKNADTEKGEKQRSKLVKSSLVEYSMALALPSSSAETIQLHTRSGDGQMLMKTPVRSGEYAFCIRYRAVGVGTDTENWQLLIDNKNNRKNRHKAIIESLRDQILSPDGALTAKLLPHLTGLKGIIFIRHSSGRAPLYSPLEDDFMTRLNELDYPDSDKYTFQDINQFCSYMNELAKHTIPAVSHLTQLKDK